MTRNDILHACAIDVSKCKSLRDELARHENIAYDASTDTWKYKPKHDIHNAESLLALVNKNENGLLITDLYDAYTTIRDDIHALHNDKKIFIVNDIVFPRHYCVNIDDDIQLLWKRHKVPNDVTILWKELDKYNIPRAKRRKKKGVQ